jgi:hypothetical protein
MVKLEQSTRTCNRMLRYNIIRNMSFLEVYEWLQRLCKFENLLLKLGQINLNTIHTLNFKNKNKLSHTEYCHMLVTRHGVWINNCIY